MATTSSSSKAGYPLAGAGGPEGRSLTTAGSKPIIVIERPRDHRPLGLTVFPRFLSASRPAPGTLQQTQRPRRCPEAAAARRQRSPAFRQRSPARGRRVGATGAGVARLNKNCLAKQVRTSVVEHRVSTGQGGAGSTGPTRRPRAGRSGPWAFRVALRCCSLHTGYDAEGNRATRTHIASGELHEYTWDYRNRLTKVIVKNSSGAIIRELRNTYDVYDRRIGRWLDPDGAGAAAAEQFWTAYDGPHAYADFSAAGQITDRYLYGPGIDMLLARVDAVTNEVNWYLTDKLGSVRQIVDQEGLILDAINYDSYGNILSETNPAAGDRFKYTAREWEAAIDQYLYRARWYDAFAGRFISEDPIEFSAGDMNLARYVGNLPTTRTDPTGEIWPIVVIVVFGVVVFTADDTGDYNIPEGIAAGAAAGCACFLFEAWAGAAGVAGAGVTGTGATATGAAGSGATGGGIGVGGAAGGAVTGSGGIGAGTAGGVGVGVGAGGTIVPGIPLATQLHRYRQLLELAKQSKPLFEQCGKIKEAEQATEAIARLEAAIAYLEYLIRLGFTAV